MTFDSTLPGTLEAAWAASSRLSAVPELDLGAVTSVAVVAAHPDDETLGAGGLIASCVERGIAVSVIVVTDGAGSHPGSDVIAVLRASEVRRAVALLNPEAPVTLLHFADGGTREARDDISTALRAELADDALLVAPWRGDLHRDHRVVGEIVAQIAIDRGQRLLEYPVWMWHWADPDGDDVPWDSLVALPLHANIRAAKVRAIAEHTSQVETDGVPMLEPSFLAHFDRASEVFVTPAAESAGSLSAEYFDDLYAHRRDPWFLATRPYESRKRAITVASLPRERFARTLEIGSSIGMLTVDLAARSDRLLSLDISADAVNAARERTADLDHVSVELRDVTSAFPDGEFDLIVLSEVGYYLDLGDLDDLLSTCRDRLAADGVFLACHWRHPVSDYPLSGDAVHERLRARLGLDRVVLHEEADFLLEVFACDGRSVAERDGLA